MPPPGSGTACLSPGGDRGQEEKGRPQHVEEGEEDDAKADGIDDPSASCRRVGHRASLVDPVRGCPGARQSGLRFAHGAPPW